MAGSAAGGWLALHWRSLIWLNIHHMLRIPFPSVRSSRPMARPPSIGHESETVLKRVEFGFSFVRKSGARITRNSEHQPLWSFRVLDLSTHILRKYHENTETITIATRSPQTAFLENDSYSVR